MAKCKSCGKKGFLLKVNSEGLCDECVQKQLAMMREVMTPEQHEFVNLKEELEKITKEKETMLYRLDELKQEVNTVEQSIIERKKYLVEMNDEILLQEFGLYRPKYDLVNSEAYKMRLDEIRKIQKDMIKNSAAVTGNMGWTVNGNASKGKKMVKDMQKLLLRAFNSECEDVIEHVKYNNFDSAKKRITTAYESISKLGQIMGVAITVRYYNYKIQELELAFEYRQKKQQEKEEQKELRARMREEAKLQKEIEEERKKLEKEQTHYTNALTKLNLQIEQASENDRYEL